MLSYIHPLYALSFFLTPRIFSSSLLSLIVTLIIQLEVRLLLHAADTDLCLISAGRTGRYGLGIGPIVLIDLISNSNTGHNRNQASQEQYFQYSQHFLCNSRVRAEDGMCPSPKVDMLTRSSKT